MHNYEFIMGNRYVLDNPTLVDNIRTADVIVYQPLDNKYGKNSSEAILSEAKSSCKFISLPYVFNHGFWPILYISKGDLSDEPEAYEINSPSYINPEPIHELTRQGHTIDEVLDKFENGDIDFKHRERFNFCLDYLREKEFNCDIKIADFIADNYQTTKLFYHPSHPTMIVLNNMAKQIIDCIGSVEEQEFNEKDIWMPSASWPYWQGSIDELGLSLEADKLAIDHYKYVISQCVRGVPA